MARENPRRGYLWLQGDLLALILRLATEKLRGSQRHTADDLR